MIQGQREDDKIYINHDQGDIIMNIEAGPVPGITDKVMKAGIRFDIETALKVVDSLKRQIHHSLKYR